MHHFCTYFDSRFLTRGLALYRSLLRHAQPFVLHTLCLDDAAFAAVAQLDEPNLRPISLEQLERFDPDLLNAKANRNLVEYYFTCTPILPLYVMDQFPGVDLVSYVDADLYFFAGPEPIFNELGSGSVLIVGHRYPPQLEHLKKYGSYNVGLLTFRSDAEGRRCLRWWRQQCLDWCYERLEETRYADQKYLDQWPQRFSGVVEARHKGLNLAPWNVGAYQLRYDHRTIMVEDDRLIFYHFHRLKQIGPRLYDLGLDQYQTTPNRLVIKHIYQPYLRQLRQLRRQTPAARTGNLRLPGPRDGRDLLRTLLYKHTMFHVGPVLTPVHLEPIVRPLLRMREATRKAA